MRTPKSPVVGAAPMAPPPLRPAERNAADAALRALATTLDVDHAVLKAVKAVESAGEGFRADGKPTILFERHIFWRRLLAHQIDPSLHAAREPTLVAMLPGAYGTSASQHERLQRAERIHRTAARESASWGAFQIMGYHWRVLRYASVDAFVEAMSRDEAAQVDALGRFLARDPSMLRALRNHDWTAFARAYNGPTFGKNRYDEKLADAHRRFAIAAAPVDR